MSEILTTWKAIALYLNNISVKTAMRYYKNKGLPVKYDPAGHPIIKTSEIEEWRFQSKES